MIIIKKGVLINNTRIFVLYYIHIERKLDKYRKKI